MTLGSSGTFLYNVGAIRTMSVVWEEGLMWSRSTVGLRRTTGTRSSGKGGCGWSSLAPQRAATWSRCSDSFQVPCRLILSPHGDLNSADHVTDA